MAGSKEDQLRLGFRIGLLLACAVLFSALPLTARKGSSLEAKGRDAEARLDYEAAYVFYTEAYQLNPKNLEYRAASTRMRVLAASQHVHRGHLLREEGKLDEAMKEFRQAVAIDPASFIAEQEIRRTLVMIESVKAKASVPTRSSEPTELQRRLETAIPPVELAPLSNALISIKLTGDVKTIYQTVGKLAGINVVFDPDYSPRPITVDLVAVTLPQALEILGYQSKTFWRALTPNTILISGDSPAKRKDSEPNILMTYYLTNLAQSSDLQDVINTVRTTLELTKLTAIPSLNAIVVRGTPDQVAIAGKLIDDMDKARPEVVVEVAVMQVSRDRLRNLGTTLPTSATITMQAGGTGAAASGTATLSALSSLNSNNFSVTLPQATVTALFSNSVSKLLQNPQLRASDGQKATMKIGQRVPIATGVSSSTLTSSALTQTQFQYIDVGVNIEITPRVHANNEITLKVTLDISAIDSEQSVGGVIQPVIGQRKIEHEIRLKEGEVNVVAGMLEDSDSDATSGYPLLSQIPILRYLFSSKQTDKRQNEIVFVLTPHLVRAQDYSTASSKALDIGTGSNISLRHAPPVPTKTGTSSAVPENAPVPQTPLPAQTPGPASPTSTPRGQPLVSPKLSELFIPQLDLSLLTVHPTAQVQFPSDGSRLQHLRTVSGGLLRPGEQTLTSIHNGEIDSESVQHVASSKVDQIPEAPASFSLPPPVWGQFCQSAARDRVRAGLPFQCCAFAL